MKTKESYQEFIETTLRQWGTKINDFEARVVKPEREKEIGHLKELDVLKAKQQEAQKRFEQLKASSSDWENLSKGVDEALEDLKASFERASSAIY